MQQNQDWRLDFADDRRWLCDSCGQPIEKVGEGRVEWIEFDQPRDGLKGRGLRIVHNLPASPRAKHGGKCQYDQREDIGDAESYSSLFLREFTPPDGLMTLIGMMVAHESPLEEIVETIRRLYVPGYEEARPYFADALSEAVIDARMPPGCYFQTQIQAVLQWVQEGRK
jgi:hypothetical protein